jgi:hypothetical protein
MRSVAILALVLCVQSVKLRNRQKPQLALFDSTSFSSKLPKEQSWAQTVRLEGRPRRYSPTDPTLRRGEPPQFTPFLCVGAQHWSGDGAGGGRPKIPQLLSVRLPQDES